MISIKENKEYLNVDIEMCVHMITFVTLWKMKKFMDALSHVETAASILNHIIRGLVESKMSKNSSHNLYCLVIMSLSALKIKINNDFKAAKELCEDCKLQLQSNSLCNKLITEFLSTISGKKAPEGD